MTSNLYFFQIKFLGSFSEGGGAFLPPPTKIGGPKGPTKIGLTPENYLDDYSL